jgi:UDP-N-acetylglucosamine 2-epimerase
VSPVPELAPGSIAVVLGTRPEHIKLAPLIRLLGPAARVIHSGQHYDPALTGVLPGTAGADEEPLWIGGQHRGIQIGAATAQLADRWRDDRPSAVVVQGDTNTALAGALAANSCGIPLAHVEAGLRSGDRDMPEEHNVSSSTTSPTCAAPPPAATRPTSWPRPSPATALPSPATRSLRQSSRRPATTRPPPASSATSLGRISRSRPFTGPRTPTPRRG